ncbi:unnamed protein product [Caenorhabditis angaria]|uniref:DUF38 domain-containing protein n=1 Tax=Caenorhabditis angaria TaxID=860376 RepID=A0A9P1I891_9PELO|nr:unnamed protein product [Caenorhabditis angaria]
MFKILLISLAISTVFCISPKDRAAKFIGKIEKACENQSIICLEPFLHPNFQFKTDKLVLAKEKYLEFLKSLGSRAFADYSIYLDSAEFVEDGGKIEVRFDDPPKDPKIRKILYQYYFQIFVGKDGKSDELILIDKTGKN